MISPSDRDLITEGSEARRKFMDGVIAQSNKAFLDALIQYNRALSQRNALLKYFAANRTFDAAMLELYDSQLCQWAPKIHDARKAFIKDFEPRLKHYYAWMAGEGEAVGIAFKSAMLDQPLDELLAEKLSKDRVLQYTSVGHTGRTWSSLCMASLCSASAPKVSKNPTSLPSSSPFLTP